MTLGQKLQKLRMDAALSQEELAARLDVSRQAVSKWELDKTVPEVKYIVALSEAFQVTTDYLLKDGSSACEGTPPSPEAPPPPPQAAGDFFPMAAVCSVMFLLAADVIFAAAHCLYIRDLLTFSTVLLLLAMILLPALLAAWRVRLRTTPAPANCRRTVAAGARLWVFGCMLLCGFHAVIGDLFISPGLSAFTDEIGLILLIFAAVFLGLWLAGRLCTLLFPKG